MRFACKMVDQRGQINQQEVARLRAVGYSERDVLEIAACVCLAICTDYLSQVTQAEVDFPDLPSVTRR